ncbi:MAG: metallophosphoesterase [Candidatus Thorarchaeota archaeon]
MMSLAIQYPERALMLRGNHESDMVARMYGFFDVVKSQYMPELFEAYCEVFGSLPLASISQKGVFSCHGGVPEGVDSLGQIQSLDRYSMEFENPIAFQMAWNDPVDGDFYFGHNRRGGATRSFGRLAFEEFARNLKIKLMVRAHEAFPEGYRRFFGGRLVSVFSTRYGHRVDPKVVHVGEDLVTDPLPL